MIGLFAWIARRSTHVWWQANATGDHDDHDDPADPQHGLGLLRHHRPHRDQPRRRPEPRPGRSPPRRIAEATEASPEGVRDFLDSRHGRHFADDVASGLARRARRSRPRSTPPSPAGWAGGSAAGPPATRASRPGFPTSPAGSPTSGSSTRCRPDPTALRRQRRAPAGCAARGRSRLRDGPGASNEGTTR